MCFHMFFDVHFPWDFSTSYSVAIVVFNVHQLVVMRSKGIATLTVKGVNWSENTSVWQR